MELWNFYLNMYDRRPCAIENQAHAPKGHWVVLLWKDRRVCCYSVTLPRWSRLPLCRSKSQVEYVIKMIKRKIGTKNFYKYAFSPQHKKKILFIKCIIYCFQIKRYFDVDYHLLICCLLAIAVYANTLNAGFVYDDK